VIADPDGNVVDIIGSGETGASDGTFEKASFNKPQGMSLDGEHLYVADTENHLIRRCHLETRMVETVAGTEQQAMGFGNGGEALQTPLSSPWDLLIVDDRLYIAMAGTHQIWVMDLQENRLRPYAGSGHEGRTDGPLMASALAQPSGITTDGKRLFIADSEISSIRSIDLDEGGKVATIVGLDLFEFGDRDGKGREVRLQHPLGVLFHEGNLYVADTYNHKIKIIDPEKKTSETLLGSGRSGNNDGELARFFEPSGLAVLDGKLYIADTNNHAIRMADLSNGLVQTLVLKGLAPPGEEDIGFPVETIVYPGRRVEAGSSGELVVSLKLPPLHKLTEGAPLEYEIEVCDGEAIEFAESDRKVTTIAPELPLRIPFRASDTNASCQIKIKLMINYCKDESGTCFIKFAKLQVPVQTAVDERNRRVFIEYRVLQPTGI
jgi:DNA-binding beta-propeller fold protein YncE